MGDERREHPLRITLNERHFTRLVVDSHYQKKHPDISDQLILELVRELDGSQSEVVAKTGEFFYLAREILWQGKRYRVVLTYCEEDFLGVVNAFRVKEK